MKMFEPLPPETELLAKTVVDAAYKVHTTLGPGLLESVYETCLAYELRQRGVSTELRLSFRLFTKDYAWKAAYESTCSSTSNYWWR